MRVTIIHRIAGWRQRRTQQVRLALSILPRQMHRTTHHLTQHSTRCNHAIQHHQNRQENEQVHAVANRIHPQQHRRTHAVRRTLTHAHHEARNHTIPLGNVVTLANDVLDVNTLARRCALRSHRRRCSTLVTMRSTDMKRVFVFQNSCLVAMGVDRQEPTQYHRSNQEQNAIRHHLNHNREPLAKHGTSVHNRCRRGWNATPTRLESQVVRNFIASSNRHLGRWKGQRIEVLQYGWDALRHPIVVRDRVLGVQHEKEEWE